MDELRDVTNFWSPSLIGLGADHVAASPCPHPGPAEGCGVRGPAMHGRKFYSFDILSKGCRAGGIPPKTG